MNHIQLSLHTAPSRILRNVRLQRCACCGARYISARVRSSQSANPGLQEKKPKASQDTNGDSGEEGAMSRRLAEMTEEAMAVGGAGARKAIAEAGFDENLRRQLEERIANVSFKSQNASAFAHANLPTSAGRGTRDVAGAQPWTGTESVEDAALRMLTDAHKPLKGPARLPSIRGPPPKVDTGRSTAMSPGVRLASARDRSSLYAVLKDESLSDQEKEQFRKEMKDRFVPGARSVPASITGLASLANQRIDDAIARGQFRNLPRGKKIERDYNASSPFLDTTEYFMNKIIQKQDIVPPWIEKQQELVSTANKFRSRLRADWKRHAARMISSKGGSLEDQIRRAQSYAAAETIYNPVRKQEEMLTAVSSTGHMSQITLTGELKPAADPLVAPSSEVTVTENMLDQSREQSPPSEQVTMTVERPDVPSSNAAPTPAASPFRDPHWEQSERSYMDLSIQNLNTMTRSYNLMAPNVAKKPYYSLDRELKACFADVAPQLPEAIRDRAHAPKVKVEVIGHRPGGVMERFSGNKAVVYDERKPQYGFKEFWKDLWSGHV